MNKGLITIILGIILLAGCKFPCRPDVLKTAFIGFGQGDLDSIVLNQYQPNDNYQHLNKSIVIKKNSGTAVYTVFNDTTFIFNNVSAADYNIIPGYDWQIDIPSLNRKITISNIISQNTDGGKSCLAPIVSFLQDGQLINPNYINKGPTPYSSGYIAYIHK